MRQASHKNKLNDKQIHLLKLLYKFRFVTASLLASYKGIRVSSINKSLAVLVDHGYVGRRYDKSYKILGKGATYFLAPKALTYLRDNFKINEQVLHAMYKNRSVGQKFVDHNLDVFSAYLAIRDSHPDSFHIFTKQELGDFDYFPETRPDIYLNRIKPENNRLNEYIAEIFADTPLFVMKKRFAAILEHFESGEWEAEAETDYPAVLFVLPDANSEHRLQEHIAKTLDNAGIDDLTAYMTTRKALLTSTNPAIWGNAQEPKALLSL